MKLSLLLLLTILPILLIPVFADNHNIPSISVMTDKSDYVIGDSVIVSGMIENYDPLSGRSLTYLIKSPYNNILGMGQLSPNSDGSFQFTFTAGGNLWELTGNYTVEVKYGAESASVSFQYLVDGHVPEPVLPFILTTDKSAYYKDEIVFISGEVPIFVERHTISLEIISPLGKRIGFPIQTLVNSDRTFNNNFPISEERSDIGIHTIRALYISDQIETTFEVLPPQIQIFTDKSSYNQIETIQITGQINEIQVLPTDRVAITLYNQNSILIPESLVSITNNTFSHDIITDDIVWNNYFGDVRITAQLQNHTAEHIIHYSSYPVNISLEYLHNMISNNTLIVNGMYSDIGIIKEQNQQYNTLLESIQESITLFRLQLDELLDIPPIIIADAPIIIDLTVSDPDNQDSVYSIDDIITITFDSDTNTPNGMGRQSKAMIDNMFFFSESIGGVYKGEWDAPDTFVITIKSIRNAGIIINTTTVTPAGSIPILSSDGTSEPSTLTSPALSGDFGINNLNLREQLNIILSDKQELDHKLKRLQESMRHH